MYSRRKKLFLKIMKQLCVKNQPSKFKKTRKMRYFKSLKQIRTLNLILKQVTSCLQRQKGKTTKLSSNLLSLITQIKMIRNQMKKLISQTLRIIRMIFLLLSWMTTLNYKINKREILFLSNRFNNKQLPIQSVQNKIVIKRKRIRSSSIKIVCLKLIILRWNRQKIQILLSNPSWQFNSRLVKKMWEKYHQLIKLEKTHLRHSK